MELSCTLLSLQIEERISSMRKYKFHIIFFDLRHRNGLHWNHVEYTV
jgi:hypothetical protein